MRRVAKTEPCSTQPWKDIPRDISGEMLVGVQLLQQEVYNSLEDFLGRLQSFLGMGNPLRHQTATVYSEESRPSINFYALFSHLDLIMRFPIPHDDTFTFSSFGWSLNLCRNAPLLFVDFIFQAGFLQWKTSSCLIPLSGQVCFE